MPRWRTSTCVAHGPSDVALGMVHSVCAVVAALCVPCAFASWPIGIKQHAPSPSTSNRALFNVNRHRYLLSFFLFRACLFLLYMCYILVLHSCLDDMFI